MPLKKAVRAHGLQDLGIKNENGPLKKGKGEKVPKKNWV